MRLLSLDARKQPLRLLVTLWISLLFFTACKKEESELTSGAQPYQTLLNISYGSDTAQRMDIYLPKQRTAAATKALVLIHGGSWNSGSEADLESYIDTFKKRLPDYAVFNINYRLASKVRPFPVPEQDVNAALQFIANHAQEYNFNKDQIALLGVSAGAHLALLQGYKYSSQLPVKAVIDFFGPTDLVSMYNQPWHPLVPMVLSTVTGTTPASNLALYQQSSPINYVNAQSAPTLILHGSSDEVVHISQSQALKAKLDQAGAKNELLVYANEGHGRYGPKLTHSFNSIEAFLKAHVQ